MDKIEEQAAKTQKEATTAKVLIEPTEEELKGKSRTPDLVIETELPHVQGGPPEGNTALPVSPVGGTGSGEFVPEPGYIRGQLMRQAAVLSEMGAFCNQNRKFLVGGALGALENAEREITAAWKSLLVSAARLEE